MQSSEVVKTDKMINLSEMTDNVIIMRFIFQRVARMLNKPVVTTVRMSSVM